MVAKDSWVTRAARPPMEERILDIATLGDALFQEQVSRVIHKCHNRSVGAVAALAFVSWTGDAYHLNRQTPGPDALWVDDTDKLDCAYPDADCDEADYAKVSFPFKCMLICGNVTRKAMARGRGFADVLALELTHVTERALYSLEKKIFDGNWDDTSPKEFDGLFNLIMDYNGSGAGPVQVLLADGAVLSVTPGSTTLGNLTLKLLDQVLDLIKMGPQVLFVSRAGRRIIRGLLQAQQRFNDTRVIQGGFEVESYFDAPIVVTDGIPDTLQVIDDGAGNPEFSAIDVGDSTAVIAVNTDECFIAELTPLTVETLPKCTTQRQKFEGYWDGTLVLACPEAAAMIVAIDPAC